MRDKYNLIDTPEKLKELDAILMDGDTPKHKFLAYDTETNGLHIKKNTVVGFSISFDKDTGYYIPLLVWEPDPASKYNRTKDKIKYEGAHKHGKLRCVWTGEKFDEFVKPHEYNLKQRFPLIPALVERWLSKTNLYMWNAPFDINMTFESMGVDLTEALFLDGGLLVHILDENFSTGLKANAERYKAYLGINPHAHAAMEKKEMNTSIIMNGGDPGMVWRADIQPQMKYGCADTFFTYGICEAALQEFIERFGERGLNWLFKQEVMPVCKEVVVQMKRRGVYIDVPYFERILTETQEKMYQLEDQIIDHLEKENLLADFSLGKSIDQEVSNQAIVKHIMKLEGVPIPKKANKDGVMKETIAKGEVKKAYAENPHWIYGYILGEDEIKYSKEQMAKVKRDIYAEKMNKGRAELRKPMKRHRYNIGSDAHLRWLFCDKLGMDKKKLPQTDSATKDNPIPSVAADVLQEHMLPKFPWVSTLLSYKRLAKMESTYMRPAVLLHVDSWLYMDMKQNGTTSGRFSCSGGYNLQTLPRVDDEMEILEACEKCESEDVTIVQDIECIADLKCNNCGHVKVDIPRPSAIKQGFIAPPGYKIVNADYSSLEPRCFAFMSNEQALKDVYLKGLDLYSQVYCEIFDTANEYSADPKAPNFLKKVAKGKRTFVKPIVLGIPYGAEDAQVANLCGFTKKIVDKKTGDPKEVPDYDRGKEVRDAYLGKLGDLKQYMDDQDLKAVTLGYVETIVGRRRHLPYAKKINDVLVQYNIDWKDLKDAYPYQLQSATSSFTSQKTGLKISFPEEALREIQRALDIKEDKFKEKGYWSYLRALLKADLNNSKNNPIQGLAGHTTNRGMLDTNRHYVKEGLDAWVALQVHDEIMSYAKEEVSVRAGELLQLGMEKNEITAMIDLPMIAEPEICDNLKDAK